MTQEIIRGYQITIKVDSKLIGWKTKNAMISHKLNEKENSRTYVDSQKVFNSSVRNEKGEPKCFSCNLFGHISKDCPNPCTLCGLKGHSKNIAQRIKKEISLSVIDHESSVTADKYLRKATINNRSVSCLLDTGASSCSLKESLAERLGINMTPCKKRSLFHWESKMSSFAEFRSSSRRFSNR
ncbi:hypothetical protein CEXT_727201 [Caerostris extrusa]|uniref:CCHC-type domain-containing protein n=1 Tax=Caerostris extrusa TaxID=172846 RepID=A0AAV4PR27_CAEEX|nr:hypothetical protein CEXT_727201 [Caerostris extrusa]